MRAKKSKRSPVLDIRGAAIPVYPPHPRHIRVSDIAFGLSRQFRFSGKTFPLYTVAQHSVLVSRLLPPETAMFGLMHDASEAYLGDVILPLKTLLADYQMIESRWMEAIGGALLLRARFWEQGAVKIADQLAFRAEVRAFFPLRLRLYGLDQSAADSAFHRCREVVPEMFDGDQIVCWSPEDSHRTFFNEYTKHVLR